jgi:hypothetical protein
VEQEINFLGSDLPGPLKENEDHTY